MTDERRPQRKFRMMIGALAVLAVVSGGASGLGLATVEQFVKRGTHCLIIDLPTSAGLDVAGRLGPLVRFSPADVNDSLAVDAAKLSKWFGYLKNQEGYLEQITAKLRAGQAIKAQRLTSRFIHNGNLANNTVLAFGFDSCSFKFSRYG